MSNLQFVVVLLTAGFALASEPDNYEGAHLFRVKLGTLSQLKAVHILETLGYGVDLWLEPSLKRPTDMYVPKKYVPFIKEYLNKHEINFEVRSEDVSYLITKQKKELASFQDTRMNWINYQSYDTIMTFIQEIAANHSDVATVTEYGTSSLGRTLRVIKIGRESNSTKSKPAFWFDGGMHAREWISPAIVTWFVRELLENQEENNDILDGLDIYITPIANPDGYEFTQTQRLWRKTRSTNNGSPCIGVDPNRNFGYKWGGPGTSSDPCTAIYKGPAPWSEPETKAIKNFIEGKAEEGVNWVSYFAIHNYAQMWLIPWGWTYDLPPTYDELIEFGKVGADALSSIHGTRYDVGSVTELLEPGAGGSDDWAYGSGIFRYSQTVEVRDADNGTYGYLLPPDQIIPCAQETFAAIQAVARYIIKQN